MNYQKLKELKKTNWKVREANLTFHAIFQNTPYLFLDYHLLILSFSNKLEAHDLQLEDRIKKLKLSCWMLRECALVLTTKKHDLV